MDWVYGRATKLCKNRYYNAQVDLVVLANAVLIGIQVDYGAQGLYLPRLVVACSNILDLQLRFLAERDRNRLFSWWRLLLNLADLVFLGLLAVDIVQDTYTWFWQVSLLRLLRYLRVYKHAERDPRLVDLWKVLAGLARAHRALLWLALLLAVVLFACAAAATGLVEANRRPYATCDSKNVRVCFNAFEYFGSVQRSMLTLLQVATLDNWASHIVRPLWHTQKLSAVFIVGFSGVTAYGLLSIAVGVLVHATVELARNRGGAEHMQEVRRDSETIGVLADYFDTILDVEDRETLITKDLAEAMLVPQVGKALKDLNLPVKGVQELFDHLDKQRLGEITVQELKQGLTQMKKPAGRFDIACLSASMGGCCTYTARMERRAVEAHDRLVMLRGKLHGAFSELEQLHKPGGPMSTMPELMLRQAGLIGEIDSLESLQPF